MISSELACSPPISSGSLRLLAAPSDSLDRPCSSLDRLLGDASPTGDDADGGGGATLERRPSAGELAVRCGSGSGKYLRATVAAAAEWDAEWKRTVAELHNDGSLRGNQSAPASARGGARFRQRAQSWCPNYEASFVSRGGTFQSMPTIDSTPPGSSGSPRRSSMMGAVGGSSHSLAPPSSGSARFHARRESLDEMLGSGGSDVLEEMSEGHGEGQAELTSPAAPHPTGSPALLRTPLAADDSPAQALLPRRLSQPSPLVLDAAPRTLPNFRAALAAAADAAALEAADNSPTDNSPTDADAELGSTTVGEDADAESTASPADKAAPALLAFTVPLVGTPVTLTMDTIRLGLSLLALAVLALHRLYRICLGYGGFAKLQPGSFEADADADASDEPDCQWLGFRCVDVSGGGGLCDLRVHLALNVALSEWFACEPRVDDPCSACPVQCIYRAAHALREGCRGDSCPLF